MDGKLSALETVRVFDLSDKFCNPVLTGKLPVNRNIPNVYQCIGSANSRSVFHNISYFLKIPGYQNHMNRPDLLSTLDIPKDDDGDSHDPQDPA